MNKRRLELGLRWATVCALADITTSTLGAIRRGANPPSEFTRNSLEKALQLQPGNIQSILEGGDLDRLDEPTQTLTTTAESDLAVAREIARELEKRLLQKSGPSTGRQSRDLKLWILASQGLRDSLDDDD
jgi:transcriptional regulator with XRE-family HTH domain